MLSLTQMSGTTAEACSDRSFIGRVWDALLQSRQRAERLVAQAQEAQQALDALNSQLAENDGVSENREALELAEETLLEAEAAAEEAEHATREAREQEQSARGPLSDAQQALQGLETEDRTLDQVLNVHSDQDFTPVVEQVQVTSNYFALFGIRTTRSQHRLAEQVTTVTPALTATRVHIVVQNLVEDQLLLRTARQISVTMLARHVAVIRARELTRGISVENLLSNTLAAARKVDGPTSQGRR